MDTRPQYQRTYDDFVLQFSRGETTPTQAGEALTRIAAEFPNYNMAMIKAERSFSLVRRDEVCKTDETTGKAISSAKAETLADASSDAFVYREAKGHVANIEMLIGALKFMQKSLEVEFAHGNIA
jgi:hypothetical protein